MLKNWTPLWRNAHLKVKMLKNCRARSIFWCSTVEKLPDTVAKCRFESQNVKKLSCSEHFLTFYCGKIACHCGETRMCKWKWSKTVVCGALLDVLMTILRKAVSSARSVFELRCEWLDRLEHTDGKDNCVFSDLFDSLASMGNCFCRSFCVSSDRKYWFDLIKIVCSLWPQVATGSRMCKWKWSKTVVCGALLDVLMTILRKAVSSARSVFELVASVPKVCPTCSICSGMRSDR